MDYKKFGSKYFVRINKGEEVMSTLKEFCKEEKIYLAEVTAIGATDKVKLGSFDSKKRDLYIREFKGEFEITSLVGTVTKKQEDIYLHFHINLTDHEFKAFGGHLVSAYISGTCEIVLDIIDQEEIQREFNEEVGLNLFKF
jgi:predicted DNA-binding protein with PD1-like motif